MIASATDYLSIPLAFERVSGIRPSPSSCFRLAGKGLRTYKILGKLRTTEDDVREFIEQSSNRKTTGDNKLIPPAKAVKAATERAKKFLESEGL